MLDSHGQLRAAFRCMSAAVGDPPSIVGDRRRQGGRLLHHELGVEPVGLGALWPTPRHWPTPRADATGRRHGPTSRADAMAVARGDDRGGDRRARTDRVAAVRPLALGPAAGRGAEREGPITA
ncbi:hypothetical protein QA943_09390 [Streptomyces sp. B21-097]|uniref:hypothetical protein n=1 Tax=Streptomyces sp. B21-097 TaxID=3039414 RepID=UPI002FEE9245